MTLVTCITIWGNDWQSSESESANLCNPNVGPLRGKAFRYSSLLLNSMSQAPKHGCSLRALVNCSAVQLNFDGSCIWFCMIVYYIYIIRFSGYHQSSDFDSQSLQSDSCTSGLWVIIRIMNQKWLRFVIVVSCASNLYMKHSSGIILIKLVMMCNDSKNAWSNIEHHKPLIHWINAYQIWMEF